MSNALIIAEGVGVVFQSDARSFAVFIDHLTLEPGDTLMLHAPSGSGKSTVLSLLGTALRPTRAERFEVTLKDGSRVDLARAWRDGDENTLIRARRDFFGYILQTGALAPFLTVAENIEAPATFAGRKLASLNDLAERLQIRDLLGSLPAQLSVGQRQRVAIARALSMDPLILLADEPTASLDAELGNEIDAMLAEAVNQGGTAMVLASHRVDASTWADCPKAGYRTEHGDGMTTSVFGYRRAA